MDKNNKHRAQVSVRLGATGNCLLNSCVLGLNLTLPAVSSGVSHVLILEFRVRECLIIHLLFCMALWGQSQPLCLLQSRKLKGKIICCFSEAEVMQKALFFTEVLLHISRFRVVVSCSRVSFRKIQFKSILPVCSPSSFCRHVPFFGPHCSARHLGIFQ